MAKYGGGKISKKNANQSRGEKIHKQPNNNIMYKKC